MMLPTRENCFNFEASVSHQLPKLKEAVRQEVQMNYLDKWNNKVKDLVVQGDFLNLLISEQSNVSWRSIIYGVPKGVMQFAMRASTNTLATPDNLKRWKVARSDICQMCVKPNSPPQKATLFHILNNCSAFLGEAERMTWRHSSVLNYITHTIKESLSEQVQVFADLEGHKVNGGTIPPHIMVTQSRCELVIIDSSTTPTTVYLFELTICFERQGNIDAANNRKYERYTSLSADIQEAGYICKNTPFEVGSRGHLTLENKSRLSIIHKICKPKTSFTHFWRNITKTSLLCSYSIYLSRSEPWTGVPYLYPVKQ